MAWLYLRHSDVTNKWYAGRTHHHNYHDRRSGEKGEFAVGMDGKELAVHIADGPDAHYVESEAIQSLVGIVGKDNVSNVCQVYCPVTGWKWDE